MKSISLAAITLILVFHSFAALAEPKPEALKQANGLYQEGQVLFRLGKTQAALEKYELALKLVDKPIILLAIAQCHRALKNRKKAVFFLKRYLADWKRYYPDKPPRFEVEVRKGIEELETELALIRKKEQDKKIAEARSLQKMGKAKDALGALEKIYAETRRSVLLVDIAHCHRDLSNATKAISIYRKYLAEAEPDEPSGTIPRKPEVEKSIAVLEARIAALEKNARKKQAEEDARVAKLREQEKQRRSKTLWAYVTLGSGVALAALGGVLYGVGKGKGNNAHNAYKASDINTPTADWQSYYDDIDSAKKMLAAGYVFIGAGAAALGASVYFFVSRPGGSDTNESAVHVGFIGDGDRYGLSLSGNF
jgi:tetratricopeptide (TPR) repeat protein